MSMKIVKPSSSSEKQTRTTVDTIEITEKIINSWKNPPFQRELKVNAKVMAVAEQIARDNGVLPGILTIGVLDGETYVVDGQHRLSAFSQSGVLVGYADVRMHWFETMGDMAKEFVLLNSSLVRLKPDDILRGMESSTPALQKIRKRCVFVGYDMVRRGDNSPVLSMSTFIRTWIGSRGEIPQPWNSTNALQAMDESETNKAIDFVSLCFEAWHRDRAYARLWGTLNFSLCAWLYRRLVLGDNITAAQRVTKLTKDDFRKCLMALSAEGQYLENLLGSNMGDRDRGPSYGRIRTIFMRRYLVETGKTLRLPAPPWTHG
jgi:hypothetical protein